MMIRGGQTHAVATQVEIMSEKRLKRRKQAII